jgi:hypothetical protein
MILQGYFKDESHENQNCLCDRRGYCLDIADAAGFG